MSKKSITKLNAFITEDKPSEDQLRSFIKDLAYENDPTGRTVTVRYSQFKRHIRDLHPRFGDEFLATINPPKELTQSIIVENKQRKLARKLVSFDEALVQTILDLKESNIPYDQAAYLQFVSGRRINEIFDSPIRVSRAHPREVSMQLSKKTGKEKVKYHKFELIKDTVTNAEFKKMLVKLRSSVNGMSLSDFTNRVNRRLKQTVRKDLSSHDLRGLHAVYRFNTDNDEALNLLGYINKTLNHGESSSDSSISYSNFKFEQ